MTPLWLRHQLGIVVFLGILLAIALGNLLALRRLGTYPFPPQLPRVSVLLPARNEEAVIGDCVRSLLAQDYPDFEVLVLDDGSTDGTGDVLAALARTDDRLRVLSGQPLPEGWLGKHWACQQLAEAATGELLLFTDADTVHHPQALRLGVAAMEAERADLMSGFLRQRLLTWGERLTVPAIFWCFFSFLPLALAHRVRAGPLPDQRAVDALPPVGLRGGRRARDGARKPHRRHLAGAGGEGEGVPLADRGCGGLRLLPDVFRLPGRAGGVHQEPLRRL